MISEKSVAVVPKSAALSIYTAEMDLDRPQAVVVPGLMTVHTITETTQMHRCADSMPLLRHLDQIIRPIEAVFTSEVEFCYDGV